MNIKQFSRGFTIIELLVATVVFSVLLLVLATAVIQIGRIYTKGVTAAKTQEATRSIMKDVSESLQYESGTFDSTAPDPTGIGAYCIGNRQFSYRIGQQLASNTHAVIARSSASGCLDPVAESLNGDVAAGGTELLGEGMRLARFDVAPVSGNSNLYKVTVRVVYGDKDLLCGGGLDCADLTTDITNAQLLAAPDLKCKNTTSGTQFCSVSELTSTVERRLLK